MASLDKLAIRGIRSFDDKQISVIEFFTPVTVIVGHNGSGKTTIIECLKYATTGDQPPNTRGGAFVHDPKMANEKEVKAQVKLRFHAANGNRMLAVRNLSVTLKKNGALTMKTLESILALADEKSGKRGAISTKCAEMDVEIPHLLGVSKAVLENVIFCHQEDSYWPLAEPSILKKKFDDIFEATKYTKALDNIKALRKDRVAELKVEKERLESLATEKAHADKLRKRLSEARSTVSEKTMEYEELKQKYEELVKANARFYDSATKFRETYMKVDALNDQKTRYQKELDDARENVRELDGTDHELVDRLKNFDEHTAKQRQKLKSESNKLHDTEEDLKGIRRTHVDLVSEQGRLVAETDAQERRIADREELIRDLSAKYQMRGYDHTPLERDKVIEFISRLEELRRRQNAEADRLQDELRTVTEEYNSKSTRLQSELAGYKQEKANLQERIKTSRDRVSEAEAEVEKASVLSSQLRTLQADVEEKERRLERTKSDMKAANIDQRLAEAGSKARNSELRREQLTSDITTLSLQADARAKLGLKKDELRSKTTDVDNIIQANNAKFRKVVGRDARADSMEKDLDRVATEKERERADIESQSNIANRELQAAEATLSTLKAQRKLKSDEAKAIDKKIENVFKEYEKDGVVFASVKEAINTCNEEIENRRDELKKGAGSQDVFRGLLRQGMAKKCCPLCTRDMNQQELKMFDEMVKTMVRKSAPQAIEDTKAELTSWEATLKDMQELALDEATSDKLKNAEVPALDQEITQKAEQIVVLTKRAEEAEEMLSDIRAELKEITTLRQHAGAVVQNQKDIERLKREISGIEAELSATGSTKTVDDLQQELDTVSTELRALDREKQNLSVERDRFHNSVRTHENDLHALRIRESELKSEIREKTTLKDRIEDYKTDIANFTARLRELEGKIADAQGPMEQLERERSEALRELNSKISEAQVTAQDLNKSYDKLQDMNKTIERYVRERLGRRLKECNEKIEEYEGDMKKLQQHIDELRNTIKLIEKEISDAAASVVNLRENLRVRKLQQDIVATQAEIESLDLEEAGKAKRIFEEKYNVEKDKEAKLQNQYAHTGGEISSLQTQLKTLEKDVSEYEDIGKKYREQLIKVKMSDMANNDLEKYAKALDNAIMKYHSLKMEEVNDTMRHLWNKTYQGTDIDGIKISSDSEGGATKRSYNYRVVMTKDQVEMDMRGRCSAGQKMLASIIIRLALADSFGQNCGILALDEPTNALDTENIDALAASLIDIINERKSNSNFQLIIITHDEGFLRKLGQSNVMEHYWRVSRDDRQKSIIERHRVG